LGLKIVRDKKSAFCCGVEFSMNGLKLCIVLKSSRVISTVSGGISISGSAYSISCSAEAPSCVLAAE
jgi:hypothetical protein